MRKLTTYFLIISLMLFHAAAVYYLTSVLNNNIVGQLIVLGLVGTSVFAYVYHVIPFILDFFGLNQEANL